MINPVKSLFLFSIAFIYLMIATEHSFAQSGPITIQSGRWILKADWQEPTTSKSRGTVLLLHKAAGDRSAFNRMADVLSGKGYASLRVDLRGHGESINVRAFDPTISRFENPNDPEVTANFELIKQGHIDIVAAIRWLESNMKISDAPFAVIGSSYTGEEMVKATKHEPFADAYIALAPGNFSGSSIAQIDPSGKPWLFVRAEQEMSFFDGIFEAIDRGSEAEIWVLSGSGHATDLFETNEDLEEKLADWLDKNLPVK